ncbi:carbon-nitrogen hydrolase [Lenzites betulinus]|nr:carbon-nitrogen hydrolase [Lenzites betulinus]
MRVAVVQFDPKIGQVQDNIRKAQSLCERLRPNTVDLVCLPEMVFTGYIFPNAAAIAPHLEEPRTGPTSRFCAALAARLHCYVVAGYPERLLPHELTPPIRLGNGRIAERIGANAAALYGPGGEFVGEYRKTNLYETDMTWAKPGPGFVTFHLPPPLGTLTLAICMDLNAQPPAAWTSLRAGPYELAAHCIAQRTRTLVLLNAWLDSRESVPGQSHDDPDWSTVNYWGMRLRPLWARDHARTRGLEDEGERQPGEELLVIICNRSGSEKGFSFAGSSSLFCLRRNSGRPQLLHAMGRRQETVEVWTYPKSAEAPQPGA